MKKLLTYSAVLAVGNFAFAAHEPLKISFDSLDTGGLEVGTLGLTDDTTIEAVLGATTPSATDLDGVEVMFGTEGIIAPVLLQGADKAAGIDDLFTLDSLYDVDVDVKRPLTTLVGYGLFVPHNDAMTEVVMVQSGELMTTRDVDSTPDSGMVEDDIPQVFVLGETTPSLFERQRGSVLMNEGRTPYSEQILASFERRGVKGDIGGLPAFMIPPPGGAPNLALG